MTEYDVILKNVPAMKVAKTGATAQDMEGLGQTLNRLFDTVLEYMQQHRVTPLGPAITLYLSMSEDDIRVEACMPFHDTLEGGEQVKVEELPAVETMVTTLHHGSFSKLNEAYGVLLQWIEANGYRIIGPNRELNLVYERGGDESKFVTEIQFPVEKV